MNKTEIIVHNEKLDLFPDTVVGITFQKNDLKEIVTRQFTYSNDFSVPFTSKNIRLLGHANYATTGSGVPYRYINCTVLSEGIQVTDDAILQIVKTDDSFHLFITEKSVPFWQAIDGLTVRDAYGITGPDYLAISHLRRPNIMHEFNTKTSDIRVVYPIAFFGYGLGDLDGATIMDARYQYPAIFVSDMVRVVIEQAGYTLDSDIVDDPDYQKMALLYAGEEDSYDRYATDNMIPDTSQKDFLKSIGFLLGVDFVEDLSRTKTIITRPFDYPLSQSPIDWTGKINWRQTVTLERFWGEWKRNNYFVYNNDEFVSREGQAILQFGNASIGGNYEAFKVPYSASYNIVEGSFQYANPARITDVDDETGEVSKDRSLNHRLVFIDRTQGNVRYTDKYNTSGILQTTFVPYAYFPDELKLPSVLNNKYKLLRGIFNRPLKITANMLLTTSDIASLDLNRLIFINDQYRDKQINGLFLINKVNNYVPGTTTEVELIEVSSSIEAVSVEPPEPEPETGYLVDNAGNYVTDSEGNKVLNDVQN